MTGSTEQRSCRRTARFAAGGGSPKRTLGRGAVQYVRASWLYIELHREKGKDCVVTNSPKPPAESAEAEPTDEQRYLAYGQALRAAVADAFDPWLVALLESRNGGQPLADEVASAIARVRTDALANLTTLIEADVAEPLSGPLEQIRRAMSTLGATLDDHGFERPARDPYDEQMLPDDVHALGPISFLDLGEAVQSAGINWGAAKAHLHMSRRNTDPTGSVENREA